MRFALWMVLAGCSAAQPRFEVASVKPADPNTPGAFSRTLPGGRLEVTHMTIRDLVGLAWGVQPFQISGGAAWTESARFDIEARPETGTAADFPQVKLMLQSLLAERFQLAVRRETKEVPIYALAFARKDERLGPGLTESKPGGCVEPDPAAPLPDFAAREFPAPPCGTYYVIRGTMRVASMTLAQIAHAFERPLGRPVVDATGDTRRFDFTMRWSPNDDGFFADFQDVLGLKLEAQRGAVEMIVIERAERPSGNLISGLNRSLTGSGYAAKPLPYGRGSLPRRSVCGHRRRRIRIASNDSTTTRPTTQRRALTYCPGTY